MGRVPDIKIIKKEDFEKDSQKLVERLAYPINSFFEQTRNLFNKNVDFTNLNQEIIEFTVMVDSNGAPLVPLQFKTTLRTRLVGMTCIRAENQTTLREPPVNTPWANWVQGTNIVTIDNVSGLVANNQYKLTFLTFG